MRSLISLQRQALERRRRTAERPIRALQVLRNAARQAGRHAYLLHIVRSLKGTGRGACILPHGVLFRGNAEADTRRTLVRKGCILGLNGLPAKLFYGGRGRGASSAKRCMNSSGDITRWVVPSRQGVLRLSTTCPKSLVCTRSLAKAGRLM